MRRGLRKLPAMSRRATVCWTMLLAVIGIMAALPGCGSVDADNVPPLETQIMFGSAGRALGQFYYPRGAAVDFERERVYVIDRTQRIQQYSLRGEPQRSWSIPDHEMGLPTGITLAEDGRLFVADTHYFRVLVYDPDANELMRFGEYGTQPGQFIYTTHVALGKDGRIYVSESGGNDRVQVFSETGEFLFAFGSFGSERGQFNRPQSMVFSPDGSELYIADACNHRIAVYTPEGELIRYIGRPGREPGELSYPYDLMMLSDGSLLVCEFHNCRLQKFSPDGESLGLYGRVGFRKGELQYPWSVAGNDEVTYVVDSGNNRVQVIATP